MVTNYRTLALGLLWLAAPRLPAGAQPLQPIHPALPIKSAAPTQDNDAPAVYRTTEKAAPARTVNRTANAANQEEGADAASASASPADNAAPALTIAVADFAGQDKELGRFLADTLLTDLAQSKKLHLVERSEIRQALTELKLQASGLAEPGKIKQVGKLVGADRLIVGSYFVRDNQFVLNARLLDVRTGRVVAGGAANVSGGPDSMLPLVHRLAHQFHKRVTGEAIIFDGEVPDAPARLPDDPPADRMAAPDANPNADANGPDQTAANATGNVSGARTAGDDGGDSSSLVPPSSRPNQPVTEHNLATLTRRVAPGGGYAFFTPARPAATVSRLRALIGLIQAVVPPARLASYPNAASSSSIALRLPPDITRVPAWAIPYVALAAERGWWPAGRALRPAEPATWAFVSVVLARAHLPQRAARLAGRPVEAPPVVLTRREPIVALDSDNYSGLVIDAHDLPIQRAMSVRVFDEAHRLVYPDAEHLPNLDWQEDNGLVAYHHDGSRPMRAGERPLVVRALNLEGDDIVISNEAAERIREENRRAHFLWQWKVCLLVDGGR